MYFRLFPLSQKKTNCYFLTNHPWKMSPHYLVKCTTFSSDWRYVIFLQTLVALKRCMAAGMSSKQRHSKCSKWPPTARIHASSLFRHWSTASPTTLCWNSGRVATRRFRNSSVARIVLDTRALAACLRRSNLPGWGQDCWLATCQHWWTAVSHGCRSFRDNVNNLKYVWIYCWKWLFWISQSKVATVYRWGRQMYKLLMSNFLRI